MVCTAGTSELPEPPPPARVLLVEDHAALRNAVAELISADEALFVPVAARSAEEALARFGEADPDLAVVDISLPGMDGLELIRRLRRLECDLPIVVLSSHSVEDWEAPALEAGARAYLLKSRAPSELVPVIRATLAQTRTGLPASGTGPPAGPAPGA